MDYKATLDVPANTTETDPLIQELPIAPGVIIGLWMYFPPGSALLSHLRVFKGEWQLWPTSPGEAYEGDGMSMEFSEWYPLYPPPWELTLKAWNEDTFYDHQILFRVSILPFEAFAMPRYIPTPVDLPWE